jgi:hypothetical protein
MNNQQQEYINLFNCMSEPLNGSNLRTIFLLLTRAHYSDPENYGYLQDQLKCVLWSSDPSKTTIEISPTQNYDINRDNKQPAIYVGMDRATEFSKLDLTSRQSNLSDNSGYASGHIARSSVNFVHVFESADQALLAAESTTSFFIGIKEALRNKLNLSSFEPLSISPPAMIEKAPERFFRVDVTFGLAFNYNVLVNIESHRLKKFAIEFTSEAS